MIESRAIVLMVGDRYFCGFDENGHVLTAWHLGGACLFDAVCDARIRRAEERIARRGQEFKRVVVGPVG